MRLILTSNDLIFASKKRSLNLKYRGANWDARTNLHHCYQGNLRHSHRTMRSCSFFIYIGGHKMSKKTIVMLARILLRGLGVYVISTKTVYDDQALVLLQTILEELIGEPLE